MLEAARAAGAEALARTPELLAVLAEAGVVDAGGTGLLLLLDAALLGGRRPAGARARAGVGRARRDLTAALAAAHAGAAGGGHGDGGVADLRYEVMYFLEAPDETIPAFKDVWAGIGDSIVVVGGDGLWNCHIHTDDIGAAVEAAIDCGRPRNIRVTDLLEQVEEERWVREAGARRGHGRARRRRSTTAVVAVATGDGIRRIFHSLGVQRIVTGGQTMNPSTAQLLEAVESAPADHVVILPNNKNIIAVADQVDAQTDQVGARGAHPGRGRGLRLAAGLRPRGRRAPTTPRPWPRPPPRWWPARSPGRCATPTCDLGDIHEGDYLGIARDGIRALASGLDLVCTQLLDVLVTDDHEIVTVIEGEGSSAAVTRHLTVWLEEHRPGVTTEIHHGGQPLYPYLFGIE